MHASEHRIRVGVRHADPIVQAGIVATLSRADDIAIATAPGGRPGVAHVDVIVTDYRAGMDWAQCVTRQPGPLPQSRTRVVVVTMLDREWDVRHAIERGLDGYLVTDCALEEYATCVRAVHAGSRYLSSSVAPRIADSLTRERLTSRENDVLILLAQGFCNKSIAAGLDISVGTVKAHVKSILGKLDAASRTEAVAVAAERGLVAVWRSVSARSGAGPGAQAPALKLAA